MTFQPIWADALLQGFKDRENRNIHLTPGFYIIQTSGTNKENKLKRLLKGKLFATSMESCSGKNVPKSCFVGMVQIGQHTVEPSIWSMPGYKYHYQVLGVYRFAQPIRTSDLHQGNPTTIVFLTY
jgi:hypothetical protein